MRREDLADRWAGVHGRLVRRVRAWLLREPTFAVARATRAFYAGTREQVAARALERLRRLLVHARRTVPLQAERMAAAGLDPERMTDARELARLPPMTRRDVAARARAWTSSAVRQKDLVVVRTGGTTSEPVPFFQDRAALAVKDAHALVLRERMGWDAGALAAFLWGAARDLPSGTRGRLARARDALKHRFVNRALYLPASDLSDAALDHHAEALRAFRPAWLQGYPSATDLLARRLLARGEALSVPHVLLTAEPVLPAQRERIARALGAEVLAFYGSRETGWIASECVAARRAHVNTAGVHLESTDDGRLLVTDLVNRGMPLVRYEIGDLGRLDPAPCPCGDPRPVLAALEGRTLDVFVLPSGRRVPGVLPDARGLQQDALGIEDARLVQSEPAALDVEWVAGANFRPEHLETYRRFLDRTFFGELTLRFRQVDRIATEPNGKVRRCVCRVPDPRA